MKTAPRRVDLPPWPRGPEDLLNRQGKPYPQRFVEEVYEGVFEMELRLQKASWWGERMRARPREIPIELEVQLREEPAIEPDQLEQVLARELSERIEEALATLLPREEKVIRRRYGIREPKESLEQIGDYFAISRERVRQIEQKALRRLRRPDTLRMLRLFRYDDLSELQEGSH